MNESVADTDMPEDFQWLEAIKALDIHLEQTNPHYTHDCVQAYLMYYQFHIDDADEYRCGFVRAGGKKLFMQFFLKQTPKATVFLVHGYLDHSGGLSKTVNRLLRAGYQVVVLDLPGHGFSEGEAGMVSGFAGYLLAVEIGFSILCDYVKGGNIIGLGHSTGAALLFHASAVQRVQLQRLILVAPLYMPFRWNLFKGFLLFVGKIVSEKKRYFKRNSHDAAYRRFIKHDPLQVKVLKAEWLRAFQEWQAEFVNCPEERRPVYLLQGTKDRTVEWKKNIEFYQRKSDSFQVAYFEGARHQLLNEREGIRAAVFRQIISFLDKSCAALPESEKARKK